MTAAEVNVPPAADLDLERLGSTLLTLPVVTAYLRHTRITSSLDYMHSMPEGGNPELEFIRDLFTLKADEVFDRWYGGRDTAACVGGEMMATIMLDLRRRSRALRPEAE